MAFVSWELGTFALLAVASGLLWLFCSAIYDAFFHPLAKMPGPRLYSVTQLPYMYHSISGDWVHVLKALHERYGPVVRIAPNDVAFTSEEAWKTIYGHKTDGSRHFDKDSRFYFRMEDDMKSIVNSDVAVHRRQRRLISHAFSDKALRGQEGVIKHYVDVFIQQLRRKVDAAGQDKVAVVDIARWFNFTTFDIIGDLSFGQPFGCLESSDYHPWISYIFDGIHSGTWLQNLRRVPSLRNIANQLTPRSLRLAASQHDELTAQTAMKRIASGNVEREDFMSYMLRHNDEKGMSEGELVANSAVLITAGSETTATILSGAAFHLGRNRQAYDKVVEEIRHAFSSEEEIDALSVNHLKYMIAVFSEAFRLYPPVPTGLPRITPAGGEHIQGYYIPEKTCVSVSQYAANRVDYNWRDPEQFIPERWLGDERYAQDKREVLQPFSVGPRNCVGKNLAYIEMRVILARLLWNFDIELQKDSINWNDQKVHLLWKKGDLNVKLIPVKR